MRRVVLLLTFTIATAMAQPASKQQRSKPSRSDQIDDQARKVALQLIDIDGGIEQDCGRDRHRRGVEWKSRARSIG